MARKVYFSFHYADVLAATNIRKANAFTAQYEPDTRSFFDKSLWEEVKKRGDRAIKQEIDRGLNGSSVTCVLIGQETWARPWVRYEILASLARGNALLGMHIHDVGPRASGTLLGSGLLSVTEGPNPFDYLGYSKPQGLLSSTQLLQSVGSKWVVHPQIGLHATVSLPAFTNGHDAARLSDLVAVYRWKSDGGMSNIATWIEDAARSAGR